MSRVPMVHAIGTKIETKNAMEAMEASGHNFEVELVPAYFSAAQPDYPELIEIPNKQVVVQKDTGRYLGTVGNGYTPLQPVDFYGVAQEFIHETGATISNTFNLHDDAVMGISFTVQRNEVVAGDPMEYNFIMVTSFNMLYGIIGRGMNHRIVCLNQLPMSDSLFELKHTRFSQDRLRLATSMFAHYSMETRVFGEQLKYLRDTKHSHQEQLVYFTELFDEPQTDRAETRLLNQVSIFDRLLESGAGVDIPGVKGTKYHTLNAITEYANFERQTRVAQGKIEEEVRYSSILNGSAGKFMQKAFKGLLPPFNKAGQIISQ